MSISSTTTTTSTTTSTLMVTPTPRKRDKGRTAVPLLLESFPAPPSFIPPSPRISSSFSNPSNPPLSLPPSTPLPPIPGPSPISDHETLLLLSSASRSRRSSKLSLTSNSGSASTRPPSAYNHVSTSDMDSRRNSQASNYSASSSVSPTGVASASSSKQPPQRGHGDSTASASSSKPSSPQPSGSQRPHGTTSPRIDRQPSITEEDLTPSQTASSSRLGGTSTLLSRSLLRASPLPQSMLDDDDAEEAVLLPDNIPFTPSRVSPPSHHSRSGSGQSLNFQAQAIHRQARSERSRSDAHKKLLRERSISPTRAGVIVGEDEVPPLPVMRQKGERRGGSTSPRSPRSPSPLSTAPPIRSPSSPSSRSISSPSTSSMPPPPSSISKSTSTPISRTATNPSVRETSTTKSPTSPTSFLHPDRALSPDITTIISKTPRPPRRSSPFFSTTTTRRPGLGMMGDGGGGRTKPRLRQNLDRCISPGTKVELDPGSTATEVEGDEEDGRWDESFVSDYGVVIPRESESSVGFGMDGGGMVTRLGGGCEFGSMESALEARLERTLEGDGSDSDSSIDLHTPLPNLMVRHGLLSPNSKLLPHASTPVMPDGRPGSTFSLMSNKAAMLKDERDTPTRRTRHRDGRLLRGGIGLTTGLGWSDSEDEDAPSPLTRRLSTLNLSRSTSASSLQPQAPFSQQQQQRHVHVSGRGAVPPTSWQARAVPGRSGGGPTPVSLALSIPEDGAPRVVRGPVRRSASESNALDSGSSGGSRIGRGSLGGGSGVGATEHIARTSSSTSSTSAPSIPLPRTPEGDDGEKALPPIPGAGVGAKARKYPSHLSLAKASVYASNAVGGIGVERQRTYSSASSGSSAPSLRSPAGGERGLSLSYGHYPSTPNSNSTSYSNSTSTPSNLASTPTHTSMSYARHQQAQQITPRPLRLASSGLRPLSSASEGAVSGGSGLGKRSAVPVPVPEVMRTRAPSLPVVGSPGAGVSSFSASVSGGYTPMAPASPPLPQAMVGGGGGIPKPRPRTGTGMVYRTGSGSHGNPSTRMRLPAQGLLGGSRGSGIAPRPIGV